MKKRIILASLLLPGLLAAQSTARRVNDYVAKRGERMGNCTGSKGNICGFEQTAGQSPLSFSKVSDGELNLSIDLSLLTDSEKISWLGKPLSEIGENELVYFHQEINVELHKGIVSGLALQPGQTFISKGYYLVSRSTEGKIEMTFTLVGK